MTPPAPPLPPTAGDAPGPGSRGPAGRWISALVDLARRFATWVVIGALAVTTLLLLGPVRRLGIDTDTADMLSARLEWRQRLIQYERAFPQLADELVVVIAGETPELAEEAGRRLAERAREEPELFSGVHVPGGGPFFRRHALLYLSESELERLADNVERYAPWLRRLEREPDLESLVATLEESLADARRGAVAFDLAPVLAALAEAFAAQGRWSFHELSWQELLLGRRATAGERRALVLVRPRLDHRSLLPAKAPLERIRALVEELRLDPDHGVRVRLTGEAAMTHEELLGVMKGTGRAGLMALLAVSTLLYLGLRSARLLVACVVTLVVGLVATAAFAALAIGHLNLISIAFAILFIGLGIDYAIHLSLRYRELRERGDPHPSALADAAGQVGPSIALGAVTTAACFYAFVPTEFVGLSELGVIAGTGMFIGLTATLTLLPALLSLSPPRPGRSADSETRAIRTETDRRGGEEERPPRAGPLESGPLDHAREWGRRWGRAAASAPRRRPRAVLGAAVVVALVGLALLPRVRFDHNPVSLRDEATESVATYLDLQADSASHPLTVAILEPEAATARATARRVARLAVVEGTVTIDDFVPEDQARKRALIAAIAAALGPPPEKGSASGDARGARSASGTDGRESAVDRDLAAVQSLLASLAGFRPFAASDARGAARLLGIRIRAWLARVEALPPPDRARALRALEQSLLGSLPDRMEALRASLDPGTVERTDLPEDLVARWVSPGGMHRVEVLPRENVARTPALRRFVEGVRAAAPHVTGGPVAELEAGDAVVRAFRKAFLLALLATTGLLLVVLRRFRETAYVLAPLLLAGLVTAAATVVLRVPLNFANIIALPLVLGVGVDAGIHMVYRARVAPPVHGDILRTSTARAVVLSALTTVASFGNLALSGHPGMASMGVLLTIGMAAVLACTLAVLPALLAPRARGDGWQVDKLVSSR